MKSYFAKLAARATLANVPVSSPINAKKMPEPFEESSASTIPSTSFQAPGRIRSADETPRSSPSPRRVQTEKINTQSQTLETRLPEITEHRPASPFSDSRRTDTLTERDAERKLVPASTETDGRPVLKHDNVPARLPTAPQPISTVAASPVQIEKRGPDGADDSDFAETLIANEQLAEIQREQSVLLHKADEFMERVFVRSKESTDREIETDELRNEPATRRSTVDESTRLQPRPRAAPPTEQVDERPGLVIGKLIVEVTPPPPAPVVPQQKIVVVRGNRSVRTVLPSSRRFGLGQF